MKKILKGLIVIILLPVVIFIIFLVYSTITDYKPVPVEQISESKGTVIDIRDTLNIFNWNIGYCGLGDDMSFFYDGGTEMRTTKKRTIENLHEIINQIQQHNTAHFCMLQEIDINSKRSYRINQYDSIKSTLEGYYSTFAYNYKVNYVPVPLSNPLGHIEGGLATFSVFETFEAHRHAFEGNYNWPLGLFMLDRCFMVQRFYTSNGKELLIINTHNSAYDDGTLRKQQMEMMRSFLINEYENGNYVVVGGDWNQMPPNKLDTAEYKDSHLTRIRVDADYLPEEWKWSYCEKLPTNRMINEVYNPETTVTTTIDFFLTSPNIKVETLKNVDLKFMHSDHNPVLLSFLFLNKN